MVDLSFKFVTQWRDLGHLRIHFSGHSNGLVELRRRNSVIRGKQRVVDLSFKFVDSVEG